VASGAYQLALHVLLLAAHRFPGPGRSDMRARVAALLEHVASEDLNDPVKVLLNQFAGPTRSDS
jgi:hypothetical protein